MENKKTIIGIIIVVILIVALVVLSYFYYKFNTEQVNKLTEESNILLQTDISTGEINEEIKTEKNFATVEKAMKELDALKQENINYILVALETEEKNIDAAIFLRKYFLAQDTASYTRMPSINLWIENDDKKIQIDSLKHDNSINSYHFNSFGSIRDMYGEHSIVLSEIEQLAMQVHGVYESPFR